VYGYHAALDLIVGWTGVDYVAGQTVPMVRQTWLLDLETLTWTKGPSEAAGDTVPPGGGPPIHAVGYDAPRNQLLLYAAKEMWAFRATAGRPASGAPRAIVAPAALQHAR
jgi:hypothetical protein